MIENQAGGHFRLGMQHRQFVLLVGRFIPGFQDRPNEGRPKAQE